MTDPDMFMNNTDMDEEGIWDNDEIFPIEPILTGTETDRVPGMDNAVVFGDPFTLGEVLDSVQGDGNPNGAESTCGLTSISNIGKMAGIELTEPEVVEYAMENDLCEKLGPGPLSGALTVPQVIGILSHYGFDSHCETADVATPERLAECIEGGHGVILGVNSGLLQDREWKIRGENGEITFTHFITLTGTVHDAESGELRGFYICDSSSGKPDAGAQFLSLDKLEECYTNIEDGHAVITNSPIRG